MSDQTGARVTGATDAQIEAMLRRTFNSPSIYDREKDSPFHFDPSKTNHEGWMEKRHSDETQLSTRETFTYWAGIVCPPTHRIIDAQTIEAIERILGWATVAEMNTERDDIADDRTLIREAIR